MTRLILYFATLVLGLLTANAQQVTGRILDSETNESIPYATIRIGETDLISNDDGYFTLSGENANESALLSISFIGYGPQKMSVSQLKSNNNIIKLALVSYDIGGVYVSNEKPNPNEVMKLVNENLTKNYAKKTSKSKVFVRTTENFKPKDFEIELKKATDLSKSEVKELNKEFENFIKKNKDITTTSYTDKLLDLYSDVEQNKTKYKVDVQKAVQLRDVNRSSGYEELQKSSSGIFSKVMDTTKFYRLKSGLIGTKDTISFSKEYNLNKKNKKDKNLNTDITNSQISSIFRKSSFGNEFGAPDFVTDSKRYTFTYVEATYLGDDLVFVIDFEPKKSKGKYSGRLYINESDYAIVRADYQSVDGKKTQGINLKLVLGVKFQEYLKGTTVIYKKNPTTHTYYLQYASTEVQQYFYLHRPIKFIELTDGEKDKISYNFKVEGDSFTKTEFMNVSYSDFSSSEFTSFKEKEFEYQILKKYDPNIWKGYNVIEPLEEMKKFEVVE